MSKTVKVQITVDITIRLLDETIDPSYVIQEMDYDFSSNTDHALITGMEIIDQKDAKDVNF